MSTPAGGHIGDASIRVTADTTAAALALRGFTRDANGQLRDLRGRYVSESRLINNSMRSVATSSDKVTEAVDGIRSAALLLSPALIPIAVQAAPIAASVGAAAVAVGVFAAAAAGQVTAISEAADAEKKYQDAVDQHGATSKQAAEAQTAYVQQIQKMPSATRTAAAALSSLKDQYQNWSDALAGDTMPVATKAFQALSAVFPKMTPLVQGTSTQLDRFVTIAAGSFASPGFDALNARFTQFATGALSKANDAIVHFLRTVDTGKISSGVSEFMDYVRANGPLVRDTVEKVAAALKNVVVAASNAGPGMLAVVNALAGIAAAVPPGVITALLQLSLALKAVRLAAAGAAAISTGVTAFATSIGAMRTAAAGASGVLPRLGAAMTAMSRSAKVAVAGTGIGLLLIALSELSERGKDVPPDVDRLTTSLKALAQTGKATGEAAKAWGTDFSGLSESLSRLNPSGFDGFLQGWAEFLGTDSTRVKTAKEDVDALDKSLADLVAGGKADVAAAALESIGKTLSPAKFAELKKGLDDYKSGLADAALEQQFAAQSMGIFGAQAQQTSAKLDAQKLSADGLRQAVTALNEANRSALGGMVGFEASIDAAAKAAQENAGSLRFVNGQLDLNSPKAQAAATALNDLAAKTDQAAGAARENGSSWSTVNGIYARGRDKLIAAATQMGLTRDEAKKLADQILKTPDKTARLKGNLEDLEAKLSSAKKQLKTVPDSRQAQVRASISDLTYKVNAAKLALGQLRDRTVYINAHMYVTGSSQARAAVSTAGAGRVFEFASGGLVGFPAGGPVRGPGTGTSDSILARVSNGEYVIPANRVQQYGPAMFDAIRAGTLATARPAAAPSVASLGVGASRPAPTVNMTYTYQLNFTNTGVLGSRREVENWFTGMLERMRLQGRLPRGGAL